MPPEVDPEYVEARRILLDALEALGSHRKAIASALTKMDHVVLTRVDPGSMTKITRGLAALAA